MKRYIGVVAAVIVGLLVIYALVGAHQPDKWKQDFTGLTRAQVHALLGNPDSDFSPKGFDGWDKPVVIGAWILVIYYDGDERVIFVRRDFVWGLGYLFWDRDKVEN